MVGHERLIVDLKACGYAVDGPFDSGGMRWAIVDGFTVPAGRYAGQTIRIAIPVPADYPATPPGGLYVSPCLVPPAQMGTLHVHDRQGETANLPGSWQYWSRPVPPGTWQGRNPTKRLVAHWNAVFTNVPA